jgi:DNA-binding XRE family transcriptional regulator
MQVHVKTPHIKIEIEGDIPNKIISLIKKEYGKKVKLINDKDEYVDIFKTDWYKDINSKTTPGDAMRIYRENLKITQAELGKRLGNIPRQNIYQMEKGKRGISKDNAKKLARIFEVPVGRFI